MGSIAKAGGRVRVSPAAERRVLRHDLLRWYRWETRYQLVVGQDLRPLLRAAQGTGLFGDRGCDVWALHRLWRPFMYWHESGWLRDNLGRRPAALDDARSFEDCVVRVLVGATPEDDVVAGQLGCQSVRRYLHTLRWHVEQLNLRVGGRAAEWAASLVHADVLGDPDAEAVCYEGSLSRRLTLEVDAFPGRGFVGGMAAGDGLEGGGRFVGIAAVGPDSPDPAAPRAPSPSPFAYIAELEGAAVAQVRAFCADLRADLLADHQTRYAKPLHARDEDLHALYRHLRHGNPLTRGRRRIERLCDIIGIDLPPRPRRRRTS